MKRIVLAVGGSAWMRQLAKELENSLAPRVVGVVVENTYSSRNKLRQLKKRLCRYGLVKTADQVLLQLYLGFVSTEYDRIATPEAFSANVFDTEDINDPAVAEFIAGERADFLISLGVGIMLPVIFSVPAVCAINLHTGITPRFRGVNPNLWAIYEGEETLLGVTTHRVDKGVDTGPVLRQSKVKIHKGDDSIEALTLRAYRAGIEDVVRLISDFEETGTLASAVPPDLPPKSYGWYGLSQYLKVKKILSRQTDGR